MFKLHLIIENILFKKKASSKQHYTMKITLLYNRELFPAKSIKDMKKDCFRSITLFGKSCKTAEIELL